MLQETAILSELLPRLPGGADVLVGPGDDCAVVSLGGKQLLLAADSVTENIHFAPDTAPEAKTAETPSQTQLQTDLQTPLQTASQPKKKEKEPKRQKKITTKKTITDVIAKEPLPPHLSCDQFRNKYLEWEEYRRKKRKPISPLAFSRQIKMLSKLTLSQALEAIDTSIANDYQGLFPPRTAKVAQQPRKDYSGV